MVQDGVAEIFILSLYLFICICFMYIFVFILNLLGLRHPSVQSINDDSAFGRHVYQIVNVEQNIILSMVWI